MALRKGKKKPEGKSSGTPYSTVKGTFSYNSELELERRLAGDRYKTEFWKMSQEDPICGAILLALTKTFQRIDWKTVDDPDGLLQESLDNVKFKSQMDDILSMFIFGHSVMETTLKRNEEGKVVWNKMYFRPQTTLTDWNYNEKTGELDTVTQQSYWNTTGKGPVDIPIKKCLLFNTTKSQVNPEGKSLFRSGWRSWYYKSNMERLEGMAVEHDVTGIPVLTPPEDVELVDENGALNKLGDWAWKTVRNIKQNSQAGLVTPPGWSFSLVASPGKRQFDHGAIINRNANQIALSMLSQFIVLGVTNESGSFALAKEQSSLFYTAVEGFALSVAEVVNSQYIGAPAIANFNGLKVQPRIVPVGVEKLDINDLGTFLGKLLKYNVITPDDELESFVRDKATLPQRDKTSSRLADVKTAALQELKDDEDEDVNEPNKDDKKEDTMEEDDNGKS